nr:DUF4439 domain-containing protein [Pseudarthrobacter oxydans]
MGFSLIPADPPAPADPPFSEQARAAALQDSLDLRAAAGRLSASAAAGGGAGPAAADKTVTLLTLQARALLSPADPSAAEDDPASATTLPSGQSGPAAGAATTAEPTLAGLASALSASGVQRLTDAATADGGMARLLAGAGTAQLLAAEDLAAAAGVPAETLPHAGAAVSPAAGAPASDSTASACPSILPAPAAAGQEPSAAGMSAVLGSALSAAVAAEQQGLYAYQAALPRLGAGDAPAAEAFLGQHRELAAQAAAHTRAACSAPPAQPPGFVLDPGFLANPRDGLARLEVASLSAYGDVIAQADGGLRSWAIAALQSAARRAAHWDGGVGPVPGLPLDEDRLPELPASPAPASTGT